MSEDNLLRELKWLSPAAKTRAGEMIVAGEKAARIAGVKAPEGELDAFLFAVGRSRGQAMIIVDSVATALDAAGDLAPKRDDGALETDKSRTYAERIAMLVKAARDGREAAADRDALLHAVNFKPGPLGERGELARKVILDDAGGLRREMVKARRAERRASGDAALWQIFCLETEGRAGGLLLRVWKQRKEAERQNRTMREFLFKLAAQHQGSHSETGEALARILGVPFPITMFDLLEAAKLDGFNPNKLWPLKDADR